MKKRLLFIHHSTGGNLIHQGNLRDLLYRKVNDIEIWDHGYNLYKNLPYQLLKLVANKLTYHTGLSDSKGELLNKDFAIKLGNNNPGDFEDIFCANPAVDNTLKQILEFDIIAFKNCYPTTKIDAEGTLDRYKQHYINMAKCFGTYSNKIFIAFTPPPLRKELTNKECAQRAARFANWLVKEWERPENVYVFDFFGLLADENGYLKKSYCKTLYLDSHPNRVANREIAPEFVECIQAVNPAVAKN